MNVINVKCVHITTILDHSVERKTIAQGYTLQYDIAYLLNLHFFLKKYAWSSCSNSYKCSINYCY